MSCLLGDLDARTIRFPASFLIAGTGSAFGWMYMCFESIWMMRIGSRSHGLASAADLIASPSRVSRTRPVPLVHLQHQLATYRGAIGLLLAQIRPIGH